MKKYTVFYWDGDRLNPDCLFEIPKSEKRNGTRIWLREDGRKYLQDNCKNGLLNGIAKNWLSDSVSFYFQHWKKSKTQGIKIKYKKTKKQTYLKKIFRCAYIFFQNTKIYKNHE